MSAEEYEEWVRAVDYPTARALPSILDYTVVRIEGQLEGHDSVPHQYIERVLISDVDAYRSDLRDPKLADFSTQWSSYVADSTALHGTTVD